MHLIERNPRPLSPLSGGLRGFTHLVNQLQLRSKAGAAVPPTDAGRASETPTAADARLPGNETSMPLFNVRVRCGPLSGHADDGTRINLLPGTYTVKHEGHTLTFADADRRTGGTVVVDLRDYGEVGTFPDDIASNSQIEITDQPFLLAQVGKEISGAAEKLAEANSDFFRAAR